MVTNFKNYRLPPALAEEAENRHTSLCRAVETLGHSLPADAAFSDVLKWVLGLSAFAAHSCTRNPEILPDLLRTGDLNRAYPPRRLRENIRAAVSNAADDETLARCLRRCRRREMVRVAWRDLAGWSDLAETMADLTVLAEACVGEALVLLYRLQCVEFGTPASPDGNQQLLVVIGMGKLGGGELNFSSDIDLLFAYPEGGRTAGGASVLSNDEFFSRLCRRLLRVIGAVTPEGIVFRTDMRLRPYGESGPIVMSFDALEAYYQQQGRDWERYAWIKARVIAGDSIAGKALMTRIKPFVYRRYLDFGAFESLRRMKRNIELEEQRRGIEHNIKLGRGGIREVEFFGQIFQLIRGGVEPALQHRSIQKVLAALVDENYIPADVCRDLSEAYVFLRRTENRLQEFGDQQNHLLPVDAADRLRLAVSMQCTDWSSYRRRLQGHLDRVHAHFSRLLTTEDSKPEAENGLIKKLEGVWLELVDPDQGRDILSGAGFQDPAKVLHLLEHLRGDPATRSLSSQGHDRLDRLIPLIMKQTGESDPADEIFNRIVDLLKTVEKRTCYLALLAENPGALVHLVRLAGASTWIVSFLAQHPVLLDELLDARALYAPPEKTELETEVRKRIAQIDPQDLEYQIENLCVFKQIHTLRVAAADVSSAIPLMHVSDRLSDVAETIVAAVVDLSWQHLAARHGEPECVLAGKACERGFLVVAYGKFGGFEMGYDSDLDLVFLHAGASGNIDPSPVAIDNAQFFSRLGQRVIHLLTAHTPAGMLYETDMRLRPSGSSGLLVSHIEAFRQYQEKSAWTWEHQALVRARVICGDKRLAQYFEAIRSRVLGRRRNKKRLQQEVGRMRERLRREMLSRTPGVFDLKQGGGGIVDIEFLVQYLVLLGAWRHSELLKWTDNVRLLGTLAATGLLSADTAFYLRQAYLAYRLTAHRLSLQNKAALIPDSRLVTMRKNVQKIWATYMQS